jgi:hypothetical protein
LNIIFSYGLIFSITTNIIIRSLAALINALTMVSDAAFGISVAAYHNGILMNTAAPSATGAVFTAAVAILSALAFAVAASRAAGTAVSRAIGTSF